MLKSKLKIYLPVILIVVFISVIYISLNNNPVSKASAIKINYDYPITDSLDTMSEAAELIVVGKYTGLNSTWNMARDPNNISQEDTSNYVEGKLYDFTIDKVVKGNVDTNGILINHRYSEIMRHIESNAVIDEDGNIIQKATKENEFFFTVHDPFFIEPEIGETYILFLSKDQNFNNYYGCIEPFAIKIKNGAAELQSNLINTTTLNEKVPVEKSRTINVIIDNAHSIKDNISGKSFDDILQSIKLP